MIAFCNEHYLDLAIQDLIGQCTTIYSCLSFVKDIIDFICQSPKRLAIAKETIESNNNAIQNSNTTMSNTMGHACKVMQFFAGKLWIR